MRTDAQIKYQYYPVTSDLREGVMHTVTVTVTPY